jgi:DNA-binding transcriptional regulator YiaG
VSREKSGTDAECLEKSKFLGKPESARPWLLSQTALKQSRGNFNDRIQQGIASVTGPELKQLRQDLSDAIGRPLSAADMARLCGLALGGGADTIRRWEVSGPSGPARELLRILAMASDRYPILENFNVFDRFNIPETERPARRQEFREKMRDEIRERLD